MSLRPTQKNTATVRNSMAKTKAHRSVTRIWYSNSAPLSHADPVRHLQSRPASVTPSRAAEPPAPASRSYEPPRPLRHLVLRAYLKTLPRVYAGSPARLRFGGRGPLRLVTMSWGCSCPQLISQNDHAGCIRRCRVMSRRCRITAGDREPRRMAAQLAKQPAWGTKRGTAFAVYKVPRRGIPRWPPAAWGSPSAH